MFTGGFVINPVTDQHIPVFIADYVMMGYGTGAVMGVPGQDERDWEFAETYNLPIVRTVQPPDDYEGKAFLGDGPAINSGFLDGMEVDAAKDAIIAWLEARDLGERTVTYKLRDWLFSRQRYWGEPFPIVYDDEGPVALPDDALPVELPEIRDFEPTTSDDPDALPEPPLARASDWVEVELDLAGPKWAGYGRGRQVYLRETNTMPQWAGSCWYYLRYLDPTNEDAMVDPAVERARGPAGRAATVPRRPGSSTSTSAASSTRCCTCCTRASGTRSCSTSVRCRRRSRSSVSSTRVTSWRPRTRTSAARTSKPPRWRSATAGTSRTACRCSASSGRWARV